MFKLCQISDHKSDLELREGVHQKYTFLDHLHVVGFKLMDIDVFN